MSVKHLTSQDFDSTINSDKPVLVDFWATWCGPCRMLGPTIDALANEVGDSALVCKLDVDQSPEIAERFGISIFFPSPDPKQYIEIVRVLLERNGVEMTDEIKKAAVRWEMNYGGKSGRCAKQFVADYMNKLGDKE